MYGKLRVSESHRRSSVDRIFNPYSGVTRSICELLAAAFESPCKDAYFDVQVLHKFFALTLPVAIETSLVTLGLTVYLEVQCVCLACQADTKDAGTSVTRSTQEELLAAYESP